MVSFLTMPARHIAILGAGISGITTAIVLQESGFSTTVYSHLRADRDMDRNHHPDFSSLFPAASIIPHTVEAGDLVGLFETSQNVFSRLSRLPLTGVRWQDHYELETENTGAMPSYAHVLHGCVPYGTKKEHLPFSQIIGREVFGWVARILFAEMPLYLAYLFRRYALSGGKIVDRQFLPDDFRQSQESCFVNCTGLWARTLFNDPNVHPIRGRLMFVHGAPFPPGRDESVFSYNYKPPDSEYPYDVYFFPRSGDHDGRGKGWLLGGSREVGVIDGNGEPTFPSIDAEMKDGVPAPIETLNRNILHGITGTDIGMFERTGYTGMRPGRSSGIRLEATVEEGKPVIPNYGHGGAGVALSWGCALKVRQLVMAL